MKGKKFILALSIVSILGAFTGCGPNQGNQNNTAGGKSDGSTVRVGFLPNITHSQALVGKEKGNFQKALGDNHKIEWKQFNAGSSEVEAFLAGAIDIGYIGPGPAINGYTKSKGDIQIIAGATDAGAILVSRKDLPIKDVKELDGKKVAVPQFGNTQDLSLRYLLTQNGLKEKTKGGTVEIVQADNPDIKTLLDKNQIDAALVPEPWGSRLVKEVGANVVLDYDKVWREGKYPTAVIAVRKDFLKQHPDIVENFLKAHVDLTEYINKNNSEASGVVNKQIKDLTKSSLSKDVLDSAFKRLTVTNNPEKDATIEMVNLSVTTGFLKQAPDTKDLVNLELLNKVLKEKWQQQIQ
ncbi:aliphatic sulfonate ABC transporter substrate-binding protein [Clostridiaceae bacterium UIB06]|uniref:Aliphatic sulfonate ABC transporter substrate-binding protein n=1 Tax=Clostridium thailandense TaxID=2794346 RepID=A0A949WQK8_9CLOT|nr:aliphatic sulfonate ABC transporter substrate-binding protein [Clostridium thailandense]MBV7272901.1 aliphatic sulfonate ABC transporter substrate-binding protein [Clostridium thailandense]MCH5136289.1 aliphatic sulfonate ABC transporter substrate-binding protein [Clostridiaceae bacterium UIB06]